MNRTGSRCRLSALPAGADAEALISTRLAGRPPAVFLDFDGTLSPIVDEPATAALPPETREILRRLGHRGPVGVVSGRDLTDLQRRVGLEFLWYGGSHGFELAGPSGVHHRHSEAVAVLPALDAAEQDLRAQLAAVPGSLVERTRFSISAHYRMAPDRAREVVAATLRAGEQHPGLRVGHGRMVAELRPDVDWGKGQALLWLVERTGDDRLVVYAGDDLTDEDAFAVVHEEGLGIVVRSPEHGDRETWAHVAVDSPAELCRVLEGIASG